MRRKKRNLGVLGITLAIILPMGIALNAVEVPGTLGITSVNPTPHGYTLSLLIFILPLAALAYSFPRQSNHPLLRSSFWKTMAILIPLGAILDLVFGHYFFKFENIGAVLGIRIPAVGGDIPVEEFIFYSSGSMMVLLLYVWNDEYWVAAYSPTRKKTIDKLAPKVAHFHQASVVFGLVLWLAAVAYKKLLSDVPEGMPWYFTYLLAVSLVPSIGFLPATAKRINWRAFSVTFLTVLLISFLWEATLGVPYNWWSYNEEMMIGIFIGAWHKLPIEAVLVWLAVTYTAVTLYEVFRLYAVVRVRQPVRRRRLRPVYGGQLQESGVMSR